MIAYNNNWLNNLLARQALDEAYKDELISGNEKAVAADLYPVNFYTPNVFIRIGLFVLTVIIVSFSFGLLGLVFLSSGNEESFGGLLIFFALACYAALEGMVQQKNHYHSGVDDALMWMTGAGMIGGINLLGNISIIINCLLIFLMAAYFIIRFANAWMGAILVPAFLLLVFYNYTSIGLMAKATAPFLLLLLSAVIYFIAKKINARPPLQLYRQVLMFIEITALICAYAVVNYFVVREAANSMFNMQLSGNQPIAFAWLFWLLTILLPLTYIFMGLRNKDVVLLRVGLLLIAAMVITIRTYYTVLPLEIAMVMGGVAMIGIVYALLKYLRTPKHGYTAVQAISTNAAGNLNIESLIIAETFSGSTRQPASDTNFGGGTFGGGGASGDF